MEETFKISKDLLKTITVDSRVSILKALENRSMTASELSRFLDKHVTTVAEHLELLKNSNLIERIERPGRKWIYYRLTREGKRVLHPESYRWVMVFAITLLIFISGFYIWNVDAYPGQLLYAVKRGRESLQLAFVSDSLGRAEKHMEFAEERLKEAKSVAEKGETVSLRDVLQEYKTEIKKTEQEINNAKEMNADVVPVLEALSEVTPRHILILKNIIARNPKIAEEVESALNTSVEGHEAAIQELKNITGIPYSV